MTNNNREKLIVESKWQMLIKKSPMSITFVQLDKHTIEINSKHIILYYNPKIIRKISRL